MAPNIKEYNERFNEKQKMIDKENAKVYSKAVNIVVAENLNSYAYMDVMMKIMDEIIKYQKKEIPPEEMFGGNVEEYAKKLCEGKPKKKPAETALEAVGILGWVFAAGFLAGIFLVGPVMPLSVMALIKWGVLLIVGILAMIYIQKKKIKSQMTVILLITLVYMGANNTIDVLFKNFEDFPINANTFVLTAVFALLGFVCTKYKNNIRDKIYVEWKHSKK